MVLIKNFLNIFFIPELRKKFLFTLGVFIVYRFGNHIPVVGVNVDALRTLMAQAKGLGGLFAYLDMFSGGGLREATIFALGIQPYISASIMMQILGMVVPSLEMLIKEGEYGRKIVNQYTRYLTFFVAIVQSVGLAFLLENRGLVLEPGWAFRIMCVVSLTVGAMFVMWLGEQISIFGLGNGSSMIIFAGTVAHFMDYGIKTVGQVLEGITHPATAVFIIAVYIAITACIVFLERGERKIPVQYTRRVVGNRVYGGQSTYIPFKINTSGVMPVILAGTMLNMPIFLLSMLAERFDMFKWISEAMNPMGLLFNVIQFILIIAFSYLWTALQFNPVELADNIKKSGGFIPGIRPGKSTAEFFDYILNRIGLVGAVYLGILASLPIILNLFVERVLMDKMPFYLGGTALLIVVGVALEAAAQIEAYLIENRYEGFLSSGRLQSRLRR